MSNKQYDVATIVQGKVATILPVSRVQPCDDESHNRYYSMMLPKTGTSTFNVPERF